MLTVISPLDIDPKLAWALRNRHVFPINLNAAPLEQVLRVPGIGVHGAKKLVRARRWHQIRLEHLAKLRIPTKKALPFIVTADYRPPLLEPNSTILRRRLAPAQLDLFSA